MRTGQARRDLSESVAAQSTLWRFRQKLEGEPLLERLRPEVNEQLAGQGVYIKSGEVSIVDASVIAAKQSCPKQGKDRQNTQDPEASWSVEVGSDGKRKSADGDKAHDSVDKDGFIKATCFPGLLMGEEAAAYADSAYQSAVHAEWLSERSIENSSIKRAYRHQPLGKEDKQFNRLASGARSLVERVFGVLKQQ